MKSGTSTPPSTSGGWPVDGAGNLQGQVLLPDPLPTGLQLVFQAWFADESGPFGFTATNAIKGTVP